ncbi:acyl carrier protein [Gimesia sp.]|uniref:acyl carrier protein n=1 Tax=Gimesia sp. TaxID=2024833 RepID=UPI000C5AF5EA|nr:acyl carrier protein [Gimesia sp.]MAX36218.1 acyl carrier protein [Gimesia sp.]HAH49664.1 acyl carrier protein [Planctomycetaceae bacterium]HBL46813.1 acyl carrier protein [Planctomycetaceae bacterium]|tara:strand:- start:3602 stop:3859 length:258 start_codon:yes stop_codon:yes gene_type:complete
MNSIQNDVRNFVADNFLFGEDPAALHNDDSFLETGIIDSTGVLELVAFIEDHYSVEVDDDELIPENLDSIDRLIAFIESKLKELA